MKRFLKEYGNGIYAICAILFIIGTFVWAHYHTKNYENARERYATFVYVESVFETTRSNHTDINTFYYRFKDSTGNYTLVGSGTVDNPGSYYMENSKHTTNIPQLKPGDSIKLKITVINCYNQETEKDDSTYSINEYQ
jgi:hypothetical protein